MAASCVRSRLPHEYTFAGAASLFGLDYAQPTDMLQFEAAFANALDSKSAVVIELITDRGYNSLVRNRISDAIK